MGKIISGFSNIGKSSVLKYKNYKIIDFDTTYFKKKGDWVNIYIECVLALKDKYDFVLITTHGDILHEMNKRNISYILVYPKRELMEEYRKRAIDRGSDKEFVDGFFSRWDTHIDDCEKNNIKNKIILNSGEYLSDIIDKLC